MANILFKFLYEHQVLLATLIGVMSFGLNMIYNSFQSHQTDSKLSRIESLTIHSRIDSYAVGLAGMKETAIALENDNKQLRLQIKGLVECAKVKRCDNTLLHIPEATKYKPITEVYSDVQKLLMKENEENH